MLSHWLVGSAGRPGRMVGALQSLMLALILLVAGLLLAAMRMLQAAWNLMILLAWQAKQSVRRSQPLAAAGLPLPAVTGQRRQHWA